MKTHNSLKAMVSIISVLLLSLLISPSATAQGSGQGVVGAAVAAAGSGGTGGSQDLGDLFILYRDAYGVPILTADSCQQPLAAPGVSLPAVGRHTGVHAGVPDGLMPRFRSIPRPARSCPAMRRTPRRSISAAPASSARPDRCWRRSWRTFSSIWRPPTARRLDPAGRLVTSTVTDGIVSSAEIDSPLQNLAIYKQLMLTGYLGAAAAPLVLPAGPARHRSQRAWRGIRQDGQGRRGHGGVPQPDPRASRTRPWRRLLPKICISVKEEVKGVVQMVRKCFLNYGPEGGQYLYDRGSNFGSLPSPAIFPPPVLWPAGSSISPCWIPQSRPSTSPTARF